METRRQAWLERARWIDDAYRAKHGGNPYLASMTGIRARAATVKVMPREADG